MNERGEKKDDKYILKGYSKSFDDKVGMNAFQVNVRTVPIKIDLLL